VKPQKQSNFTFARKNTWAVAKEKAATLAAVKGNKSESDVHKSVHDHMGLQHVMKCTSKMLDCHLGKRSSCCWQAKLIVCENM